MNRLSLFGLGVLVLILGASVALSSPSASATPGSGILYGTDAGAGDLYEINTVTGVGTLKGNILPGGTASALAGDPITNTLYELSGGNTPDLYSVVPTGAVETLLGSGFANVGEAGYGGADFDATGQLWATINVAGTTGIAGTGSDHLVKVNKANGAITVVGPLGTCTGVTIPNPGGPNGSCTIEGMDAIAFDSAGTLWGAKNVRGDSGANGLYTINTTTGAATFVVAIDDAATGLHPSGGVSSIQFACDGTLYAGSATRQGAPNVDGGKLGSINTSSGLFTFISASPVTTGSPANSLGGLAEIPSNCPFNVNKTFTPANAGSVTVSVTCTNGGVATATDSTASAADDANFNINGYTLGSNPTCTATESGVPVGYSSTATCSATLSVGSCTLANQQTSTTWTINKVYSPVGPVTPVTVSVVCTSGNISPNSGPASPGSPFTTTITLFSESGTTCSASEMVPAGFSASYSGCTNVSITNGVTTPPCTITNSPAGTPTTPPVGGLVDLPISGSGSGGASAPWLALLAMAAALVTVGGVTFSFARRRI